MKRNWTGRLVPIGEASGDRRIFKSGGEFAFRTFPLPLMHQKQTSGGHDESVTVGSIRTAEVREDGIYAEGVLFDTPEAQEAAAMLEEGAPATAGLTRRISALPALTDLATRARREYGDLYCGGKIEQSLRQVLRTNQAPQDAR